MEQLLLRQLFQRSVAALPCLLSPQLLAGISLALRTDTALLPAWSREIKLGSNLGSWRPRTSVLVWDLTFEAWCRVPLLPWCLHQMSTVHFCWVLLLLAGAVGCEGLWVPLAAGCAGWKISKCLLYYLKLVKFQLLITEWFSFILLWQILSFLRFLLIL